MAAPTVGKGGEEEKGNAGNVRQMLGEQEGSRGMFLAVSQTAYAPLLHELDLCHCLLCQHFNGS